MRRELLTCIVCVKTEPQICYFHSCLGNPLEEMVWMTDCAIDVGVCCINFVLIMSRNCCQYSAQFIYAVKCGMISIEYMTLCMYMSEAYRIDS